jgi:2-polyprenyl-3-methyl-5-hydroxy-6-metoxy-1,4-benzoquinol methylase
MAPKNNSKQLMFNDLDSFIEYLIESPEDTDYIEDDKEKEIQFLIDSDNHYNVVDSEIPDETNKKLRILDVGPTPFTIFLKQKHPEYEFYAIDRTDHLGERFKAKKINLKTCNLDEGKIPYEGNFFDVIIFTEVLEHVFHPHSKIMLEVKRVLRNNGKLIFSVPNIARLANRVRLMLGHSILSDADEQLNNSWIHGHGHLHEYTKKEAIELLDKAGFFVEKVKYIQTGTTKNVYRERKRLGSSKLFYQLIVNLVPQFRYSIHIEASPRV